jgi:integrase
MAQIYRPWYIDKQSGKRKRSRTWHVRYYTPDGVRHHRKGFRDKRATETLAAELERKGIQEAAGIIDPTHEHAKRPLAEHAEDFRRYLAAKGNTADYVGLVLFRLTALLDGCRFVRVADVQASAVVEFLSRLRQHGADAAGKSVKTANEYLAAAKGFTRWLWRDKRTCVDVLAGLSKLPNGESDVRHARRDLSLDELGRLLDAARASRRVKYKLAGIDRHALYLTAASTGFRVSELASMTPESFDLAGDTPTATVQAACTKNRKEAIQPLPLDVAAVMRKYLAGKPAGKPVWPGTSWSVHASILVRLDLADARRTWLESLHDDRRRSEAEGTDFLAYRDAEGRYADFHGLRHTFITMVGKAGVSPKEHQDLARHSTYALTGRYTHSRFYDLAAAVQALPIPTAGPETDAGQQALRATGTDGGTHQSSLIPLCPNLCPQPAKTGDSLRLAETEEQMKEEQGTPAKPAFSVALQGSEKSDSRSGIRESNPSHSLGKAGHGRYTNPAHRTYYLPPGWPQEFFTPSSASRSASRRLRLASSPT